MSKLILHQNSQTCHDFLEAAVFPELFKIEIIASLIVFYSRFDNLYLQIQFNIFIFQIMHSMSIHLCCCDECTVVVVDCDDGRDCRGMFCSAHLGCSGKKAARSGCFAALFAAVSTEQARLARTRSRFLEFERDDSSCRPPRSCFPSQYFQCMKSTEQTRASYCSSSDLSTGSCPQRLRISRSNILLPTRRSTMISDASRCTFSSS